MGIMRKLGAFLGMRVVTYCIMSNHFHLLVEEPDAAERDTLDRETLLKRASYLYDGDSSSRGQVNSSIQLETKFTENRFLGEN